jgi:NAD-dependent deacetylase sirtuin 1
MFMMWKLIFDIITDPQPRQKLPDINTLEHVIDLLKTCRNVLVLTGAGVSILLQSRPSLLQVVNSLF